ncbi:1-(5-phosphoribosyl)-5-[(5-phosphoribosylamino) methylideneamino]imidazole-4-carboxamide isomerase [Oleiagrimonas citrea]|jgi:phosphoribosylformimino-5-aminoimidazole carboxamide ribotide isomerase|uniref:1-(5-phosphoribosyl)-5-[(5-phosphoribosylamino)methylideneamino] imidazole-4-carboxamide isomerase n=1 Tax=Oleiagrimonas citrea TaxID=1665687 RepID=A0A846ZJN1_9GAMM|nr:1-(5-phosphoribosyl)-5-[(5-phosphoribosylamino)methylideneamino]imidazole-4-carboxamide isomerase [Oleiagrimonas citrea]NKZ37740.1 1-(5-phosphoribosyl)-5-[(5-phosphoribosylamino)methylideneamino]imidazole-4-carboxamide isomerase [Oleiagrimonas citrea]
MNFTVYPAIDLREGRVVRLYQGDYARQTEYAIEPLQLAHEYAGEGAKWLHVVDLDGARNGQPTNLSTLTALAHAGLKVQAGGGVRGEDDVRRLFDAGVTRVVVGSVAVRDPQRVIGWLERFGSERLTLALDTRWRDGSWRLPSAGWEKDEDATLDELAPHFAAAGARHLLCTDIDRDGTMSGPNLSLFKHLRHIAPTLQTQVSGGARAIDDVRAAREAGAAGIVLGRALLEGRFTLGEALLC